MDGFIYRIHCVCSKQYIINTTNTPPQNSLYDISMGVSHGKISLESCKYIWVNLDRLSLGHVQPKMIVETTVNNSALIRTLVLYRWIYILTSS